ncbi:hypothetical protein [uncultured Oscillibacter sp.]|uniref:hypothetical protein n=1 Tax=uncultured Oscillibacter sp. TaxID=876091 RepID=UPI0025E06D8A|nr:hypothetical protein [uncultured Oscillibacter sp.]
MKRMDRKWLRRTQAAGAAALVLAVLAGAVPGAAGVLCLLLFFAAVAVLLLGLTRHLRCPGCGRCLVFWRTAAENSFCSVCGTRFDWTEEGPRPNH